jgi:hypothetical protein
VNEIETVAKAVVAAFATIGPATLTPDRVLAAALEAAAALVPMLINAAEAVEPADVTVALTM